MLAGWSLSGACSKVGSVFKQVPESALGQELQTNTRHDSKKRLDAAESGETKNISTRVDLRPRLTDSQHINAI